MPSIWVNMTDEDRAEVSAKVPRLAKKMVHKKITTASAKGKGMSFQRKVCELLAELIGVPYTKEDSSLISPRTSGCNGTDIILRGAAHKLFPYACECKSAETLNLVSAIEQAKANISDEKGYIIFHKKKALCEPIIIMNFSSFSEIWKQNNV
jgi:hypothetical protein